MGQFIQSKVGRVTTYGLQRFIGIETEANNCLGGKARRPLPDMSIY